MKKTLIALAAVAAATGAMAQATISGVLDFGAVNNGKTTTTAAGGTAQTNVKQAGRDREGLTPSQIVFSATEDLGGGLKATALFSQRAQTGFAERDTHITVSGGFGSVRVGRYQPATNIQGVFEGSLTTMTPGSTNDIVDGTGLTQAGATPAASAALGGAFDRQSGVLQYTSPSFNGLTASIVYINNSEDSDAANRGGKSKISQNGIVLNYTQGPLQVAFSTSNRKVEREAAPAVASTCLGVEVGAPLLAGCSTGSAAVTARQVKADMDVLGASYDFGVAKVSGAVIKRKDRNTTAGTTENDISINSVGVSVPMGAFTLTASTYSGKDKRGSAAADDMKMSGNQLGVTYALSKRTTVYAITGKNEIKRDNAGTTQVATKTTGTSIGIRHNF
jgi:predicted porin